MRRPSNLSESLHQRLNSYALAASAAGVSVLALAHPAEAKIVYHHAHHVIGANERYKLDVNHDGMADFSFVNTYGCNFDYCYDHLSAIPIGSNAVEGKCSYSICYAYALKAGSKIGASRPFSGRIMVSYYSLGQWINVNDRYLGLKFQSKGKQHFGWARLNVHLSNAIITATLTGYAYETIPNKSIIAGKTHGKDVITLEPASLGHLAGGASGLSTLRQGVARK